MPDFYPEDDTVLPSDNELRSLHKIASNGGGMGGALDGFGAPSAGLGSNGNLYVDKTNRDLYAKIGGTWELWLDMV